jgi:hypothetical protein
MTLIMYAVKSGASGVGNVDTATKITEYLIDQGADLSARYNKNASNYCSAFGFV